MYVESKPIPEPPVSGFGSFGAEGIRIDSDRLKAALVECGASALFGGSLTDCAWRKIREAVAAQPEYEAVLTAITTSSCSDVLTGLGMDGTAAAAACAAVGRVWSQIQQRAFRELEALRASRIRLENRDVSAGGGQIVYEEGKEPRIICPANDAHGTSFMGDPGDLTVRCPPGTGGIPAEESGDRGVYRPVFLPGKKFQRPPVGTLTGRISGRVTDAGGKPIVGAEIRVGDQTSAPAGVTDATGGFSVPSGATSNQVLYISAPGYQGAMVEGLSVAAGGTVDIGEVVLATMTAKAETGTGGAKGGLSTTTWLLIAGGVLAAGGVGYWIYRSRKGG